MNKFAGIGSRKTPEDILLCMEEIAKKLCLKGYKLRSGGALGADQAFEKGYDKFDSLNKEIFYAKDAGLPGSNWAWEEVLKYIPTDRKNIPFDKWALYVRQLLVRNMMQILGRKGDQPVHFVLCWAPSDIYADSSAGGTGWAIRCANRYGIPVFNLYIEQDKIDFNKFIETI